jgi:hypothetical protein
VNNLQRITLGLSATIVIAMVLFPPWIYTFQPDFEYSVRVERFAGYNPIWKSNAPTDVAPLLQLFSADPRYAHLVQFSIRIDTVRLGIQIGGMLLVVLLLLILLRGIKPQTVADA